MTFPTELERLLKAYAADANAIERFRIGQQIDVLLRNHADAILGLVRAADDWLSWQTDRPFSASECRLADALAKLNGGKG